MTKTVEITEVYPKIFRLCFPLPLGIEVNLYLFAGEVPTLIDTGTKGPETMAAIREGMKQAGIEKLQQILLTHWHVDHGGASAALAAEGTQILISARDYEEWLTFSQEDRFTPLHEWMKREWGVPEDKVRGMFKTYKKLQALTDFPDKVSFINPGESIQAGDYRLQAVFTPGHTAGHLSFWAEEEKLLFSGDLLLPDQVPYPGAWLEGEKVISGLPDYLESIKAIEKLGGNTYFPAHGEPQADPAERCREVLAQIEGQVTRHMPAENIYLSANELCKDRPELLFYFLHYVYGWETVKEMEKQKK